MSVLIVQLWSMGMKQWKQLGLILLVMLLFTAYVVSCSGGESGDESSKEQTTSMEGGQSSESGGEETTTTPQEKAPPSDAGPAPEKPGATDNPTPTETGPEGGPPKEVPPPEPPPPWSKDEPAAPKPYSGGKCPTLKAGTNTFQSGGKDRSFDLYLPTITAGAPLLFMWHGLGDNPKRFAQSFGASQISANYRVIVVVPKGASGPTIPADVPAGIVNLLKTQAQAFFETWSFFEDHTADLQLFDDVLACASQQFKVNSKKVYTAGFSAGALWSTYLTMHRSEYLAAALLLSGGNMDKILDLATIPFIGSKSKVRVIDTRYVKPSHPVPVMLTAGGAQDVVSMANFVKFEFQKATDLFRQNLLKDKHFVIQCNHNQGHTVPQDLFPPAIDFLFKHEFTKKSSPLATGLPSSFPSYCSIKK